jgi:hypothetical protein
LIGLLCFVLAVLASPFKPKLRLEAENAALRRQVIVLRRKLRGCVRLTNLDRWFFVQLYRLFPSIQPETPVRWHRAGFRCYWRWKSRRRGGRPQIEADLRALIRQMSMENLLWGAPRIHGELLKLGDASISAPIRSETGTMPTDHSVRSNDRQYIIHLGKKSADTSQDQSVDRDEGRSPGTDSPQHIDLLPQDQNFCLEHNARPQQVDHHSKDQSAQIQHRAAASPESRSTASRIGFTVGTGFSRRSAQFVRTENDESACSLCRGPDRPPRSGHAG